jgi:hypothetical protein
MHLVQSLLKSCILPVTKNYGLILTYRLPRNNGSLLDLGVHHLSELLLRPESGPLLHPTRSRLYAQIYETFS